MNEIITKENIKIENMIYEIRGKEVMLDSDLARLYQVETKRINEAVKNNIDKFPERFSWKLTSQEYENLRSKFSTANVGNNNIYGHPKEEVLETLGNSKIYRTDLDSSIEIK